MECVHISSKSSCMQSKSCKLNGVNNFRICLSSNFQCVRYSSFLFSIHSPHAVRVCVSAHTRYFFVGAARNDDFPSRIGSNYVTRALGIWERCASAFKMNEMKWEKKTVSKALLSGSFTHSSRAHPWDNCFAFHFCCCSFCVGVEHFAWIQRMCFLIMVC